MLNIFMYNAYSETSLCHRNTISNGVFVVTANELFLLENSL